MLEGTIVRGTGGLYVARVAGKAEFTLRCKGKFRKMHITPMVGDVIDFSPGEGEQHGWVEDIKPRKTLFIRPPVANVELMMIVCASAPAPDKLLIDKLMLNAFKQGLTPLIVVNKCDEGDRFYKEICEEYAHSGAHVYSVSALDGMGIASLQEAIQGRITCFAGQSGVGKSTLINALTGMTLKTGRISEKIKRGKHTTRHAELIEINGLKVLDTPGFSLLEMDEVMDPASLQVYYEELEPYQGKCKFSVCYHDTEPGCSVIEAERAGKINAERMARYRSILALLKQQWRDRNG